MAKSDVLAAIHDLQTSINNQFLSTQMLFQQFITSMDTHLAHLDSSLPKSECPISSSSSRIWNFSPTTRDPLSNFTEIPIPPPSLSSHSPPPPSSPPTPLPVSSFPSPTDSIPLHSALPLFPQPLPTPPPPPPPTEPPSEFTPPAPTPPPPPVFQPPPPTTPPPQTLLVSFSPCSFPSPPPSPVTPTSHHQISVSPSPPQSFSITTTLRCTKTFPQPLVATPSLSRSAHIGDVVTVGGISSLHSTPASPPASRLHPPPPPTPPPPIPPPPDAPPPHPPSIPPPPTELSPLSATPLPISIPPNPPPPIPSPPSQPPTPTPPVQRVSTTPPTVVLGIQWLQQLGSVTHHKRKTEFVSRVQLCGYPPPETLLICFNKLQAMANLDEKRQISWALSWAHLSGWRAQFVF